MGLYQHQFSDELNQPRVEAPEKIILIASTPRCGSHMLGHAMAGTGLLGVPFEYCNPANLAEWRKRFGSETKEHALREVMALRTTPNGVFSLKEHFGHCRALGDPAAFWAHLPGVQVVHVRRADVLRQAISYAIARQTGVWISGMEAASSRIVYDAQMIATCLDDIALQNACWATSFAQFGIKPLDVFYEEMVRDIAATVTDVARFAKVIPPDGVLYAELVTQRQGRGERTEEWIRRYESDRRRRRRSLRQRITNKFAEIGWRR